MHVIPQGGAPKKGGPRQVPRSPPLKHTTANGQIVQKFVFTFLLGIYNLKPVALFTNSMKKCMDIENGGSV